MKKLIVLSALVAAAGGAFAKTVIKEEAHYVTPIEWGLASPLQLPCTVPYSSWRVWGLRLDAVFSRSLDVYGLDAGAVGMTYDDFAGVQGAAFNWVGGDAYGVQFGGVGNVVKGTAAGIQLACGANYSSGEMLGVQAGGLFNLNGVFCGLQLAAVNRNVNSGCGLQLGVWNTAENDFVGGSFGIINYSENMTGLQVGFVNYAVQAGEGLQVGVFNAAGKYCGLQLGLLNLVNDGERPYIAPFVNARF